MTSTDTLLPCPFCGGENACFPVVQKERVKCEQCRSVTDSYAERHQAIAAWNRRTPPTPATDTREAVARALFNARFTAPVYPVTLPEWESVGDDEHRYTRALADAALSAIEPIRAAEILAAEAAARVPTCDGCGSTKSRSELAAMPGVLTCCPERKMVPPHPEDIQSAAEARERARWVDWLATGASVWRETADNAMGDPLKFAHAQSVEYALLKVMDDIATNALEQQP